MVSVEDCVGLNLVWIRTQASTMSLQLIFGMTYTPLSTYIRYERRILIAILKQDEAKIKLPSINQYCSVFFSIVEVATYQGAIKRKYPMLEEVWCTMDGLKLRIQKASANNVQNRLYNGWTSKYYVSAIIVFCPDGQCTRVCS